MLNPLVTVLMTVYNDEKFIEQSIKSILGQTFSDYEFIIVNDGSRDGTKEIIEKFRKNDSRIKVIHQENSGTTIASNKGLGEATGKYVARLDSDDISFPYRLEKEVQYLENNPNVALIGGGCEIIDEIGNVVGVRNVNPRDLKKTLQSRCFYQQSDVMYKRELVVTLGGYRSKFRNAQDYDLWLRISEQYDIAKLPTLLGQWRLNSKGYTLSRKKEQINEMKLAQKFSLQRKIRGYDDYELYIPDKPTVHRKSISSDDYLLTITAVQILSGNIKEAQKTLRRVQSLSANVLLFQLLCLTPTAILSSFIKIRNFYLNVR